MPNTNKYPFKPSEVMVVEASAGAGKTYALSKRYLNLLINPALTQDQIPLKYILAITFTNKATLEMKQRILGFLRQLAFDSFRPDEQKLKEDLIEAFAISFKEIQIKSTNIMDNIIRDYDQFQVQTIDSFINALLTGCALHIDRTAGFRIKEKPDEHLSYSLDLVIEDSAKDEKIHRTLEKFMEQYISSSENAGWFPKKDMFDKIKELFRASNKYGMAFNEFDDDYSSVIKLKKKIHGEISDMVADIPEGLFAASDKKINNISGGRAESIKLEDLGTFNNNPEPKMKKGTVSPESFKNKWSNIRSLASELAELEITTKYPVYVKLLNMVIKRFSGISMREDILFLEELNCKASDMIGNEKVGIPELYYRLATRFKNYLLDEFQDTSELQWRNLKLMIDDALASGGSLFYVGDRKQSIFRFRGGEPKLFEQVAEDFGHYNVNKTFLTKNRRSQKEIVLFNNWVFSKENLNGFIERIAERNEMGYMADSLKPRIHEIYDKAKQDHLKEHDKGYVRIEYVVGDDTDSINETIKKKLIETIKQLSKRFQYKDIAILVRSNKNVELVTNWLLDEKLPVESERTLNTLKNRLIMEIISFLKFLSSPIDDLNFAGFVLGEIFSKATGLKEEEIRDYLFGLRVKRTGQVKGNIYTQFRDKYPKIWNEYIDWFFKSSGFVSPYELIVSIFRQFNVMNNFPENQAFFLKFLDFVKSSEDEYIDLDELVIYLEEEDENKDRDVYVSAPQSDAIKIQTIHKSKGLEFPVVILPFLEIEIKKNNQVVSKGENGLDLLYIKTEHKNYSKKVMEKFCERLTESMIDELNTVYVSLTRAVYELYAFLPSGEYADDKGFKNPACYLIPKGKEDIIEKGSREKYQGKEKTMHSETIKLDLSGYQDWIKSLREEESDLGYFKRRDRIIEGNIMHFLLANIDNCFGADIGNKVKAAIEKAKIAFPAINDAKPYSDRLNQLLKNPDFKPFFYVEKGTVYCEKELANKFGDTKRIDRLVITDKQALIIDYKSTDESREEHGKQVKEYAEIIKAVYPSLDIKAYIIFLDTLRKEEIKVS